MQEAIRSTPQRRMGKLRPHSIDSVSYLSLVRSIDLIY